MQFIQYLHRDSGSNTVSFALVAPLLIGTFLAVSQIANVVNVQTVMHAAAKSGAREASRYDATLNDGVIKAESILAAHGINKIKQLRVFNRTLRGQNVIEVSLTKDYRVPWLNYSFEITAIGQALDEKSM